MPVDYNPYLTIDSQPVDLTAFNGLPRLTAKSDDPGAEGHDVMFASHQRGETNAAADGANDLWKQHLEAKPLAADPIPPVAGDKNVFNHVLQHTLGYLNNPPFGKPRDQTTDSADPFAATDPTANWLSTRGDPSGAAGQPFPWLTFNGRPYISPLDLLLVPWLGSSQLLRHYNIAQPGDPYTTANVPFPHLLDLFISGAVGSPKEELHRILEYLRVPSAFVGTEAWANPSYAASPYLAPFNAISTYREPGRINLNTIYSPAVFNGLMAGQTSLTWDTFVRIAEGMARPRCWTRRIHRADRVCSSLPLLRRGLAGADTVRRSTAA